MTGRTQEYISGLERGARNPSRDMVARLAGALAPEGAGEASARNLLNEGLLAAGFAPTGEVRPEPFLDEIREAGVIEDLPPETQQEILDYIRFKAEQQRRRRDGEG